MFSERYLGWCLLLALAHPATLATDSTTRCLAGLFATTRTRTTHCCTTPFAVPQLRLLLLSNQGLLRRKPTASLLLTQQIIVQFSLFTTEPLHLSAKLPLFTSGSPGTCPSPNSAISVHRRPHCSPSKAPTRSRTRLCLCCPSFSSIYRSAYCYRSPCYCWIDRAKAARTPVACFCLPDVPHLPALASELSKSVNYQATHPTYALCAD